MTSPAHPRLVDPVVPPGLAAISKPPPPGDPFSQLLGVLTGGQVTVRQVRSAVYQCAGCGCLFWPDLDGGNVAPDRYAAPDCPRRHDDPAVGEPCGCHELPATVAADLAQPGLLDALLREAHAAGIAAEDLDELVHDLAAQQAADAYNSGTGPGPDTGDALADMDAAHDAYGLHASAVNNAGLAAQLSYLASRGGLTWVRERLRTRNRTPGQPSAAQGSDG